MLGPWSRDAPALRERFRGAAPYPHVVIDDFLAPDLAAQLARDFPAPDADLWHVYDNPLEKKRACSSTGRLPTSLREAIFALCGPAVVELMRQIAGVDADAELQADRFCHGGGLHCLASGGKLDVHLDYSLHPRSGLERRLNLIVFLNEEWEEGYGGELQLFDAERDEEVSSPSHRWRPGACRARVLPTFNRAVLFDTTAPSFHGLPDPIRCPASMARQSIALYYLTPPRNGASSRSKALFVATPGDEPDDELEHLRQLRAERRLVPSDFARQAGEAATRSVHQQQLLPQQVD
tara:strand:- start:205 stop:1083 length:879 start_codon:yes stop_codon:yes gene_type:complete